VMNPFTSWDKMLKDWIWRMPLLQQPLLGMTTSQSWQPLTQKSPRAANLQNEMWDELWLFCVGKGLLHSMCYDQSNLMESQWHRALFLDVRIRSRFSCESCKCLENM
jgi:hypothetical protein